MAKIFCGNEDAQSQQGQPQAENQDVNRCLNKGNTFRDRRDPIRGIAQATCGIEEGWERSQDCGDSLGESVVHGPL